MSAWILDVELDLITPATSSFCNGLVLPIPTLPSFFIVTCAVPALVKMR